MFLVGRSRAYGGLQWAQPPGTTGRSASGALAFFATFALPGRSDPRGCLLRGVCFPTTVVLSNYITIIARRRWRGPTSRQGYRVCENCSAGILQFFAILLPGTIPPAALSHCFDDDPHFFRALPSSAPLATPPPGQVKGDHDETFPGKVRSALGGVGAVGSQRSLDSSSSSSVSSGYFGISGRSDDVASMASVMSFGVLLQDRQPGSSAAPGEFPAALESPRLQGFRPRKRCLIRHLCRSAREEQDGRTLSFSLDSSCLARSTKPDLPPVFCFF